MAATWRFSCLFFREQLVNDDIGDAKVITGPDFEDRLSTHRATLQSRERYSTCANTTSATVWYRYTPATAGVVTLDTLESDFDTVIAVWSGNEFDDFVQVTCSDDAPLLGTQSVTFSVFTGKTYFIQVGGWRYFGSNPPPWTGNLVFRMRGIGI